MWIARPISTVATYHASVPRRSSPNPAVLLKRSAATAYGAIRMIMSMAFAEIVPMPADAKPEVPPGFSVDLVASGLNGPRAIRVAPNGDLFVGQDDLNFVLGDWGQGTPLGGISAVPEPSGMLLAIFGVVGLVSLRSLRRRR